MTKVKRGIGRAIELLDCLHNHRRPMVANELAVAMGAPLKTATIENFGNIPVTARVRLV